MNEQHLYPKGNNFITDWEKYRKKHYFCDTFVVDLLSQSRQINRVCNWWQCSFF